MSVEKAVTVIIQVSTYNENYCSVECQFFVKEDNFCVLVDEGLIKTVNGCYRNDFCLVSSDQQGEGKMNQIGYKTKKGALSSIPDGYQDWFDVIYDEGCGLWFVEPSDPEAMYKRST